MDNFPLGRTIHTHNTQYVMCKCLKLESFVGKSQNPVKHISRFICLTSLANILKHSHPSPLLPLDMTDGVQRDMGVGHEERGHGEGSAHAVV